MGTKQRDAGEISSDYTGIYIKVLGFQYTHVPSHRSCITRAHFIGSGIPLDRSSIPLAYKSGTEAAQVSSAYVQSKFSVVYKI